jgi:hypothetical protein
MAIKRIHNLLEHFHQSCSDELDLGGSGLFGFWLPPSPRLRRTGRLSSVAGFCKPAPSPKPRQKPKILAAHRYIFSVNALVIKTVSPLQGDGYFDR